MADAQSPVATPAQPQATAVAAPAAATQPDAEARDINTLPIDQLTPAELEQVALARAGEITLAQLAALSDATRAAVLAATGAVASAQPAAPVVAATEDGVAANKSNVADNTTTATQAQVSPNTTVVNVDCGDTKVKTEAETTTQTQPVVASQIEAKPALGPATEHEITRRAIEKVLGEAAGIGRA